MTQPLVPADVDLRGMPYMPLDVGRLRDSSLAIEATGDEFRAAVLLWCAAWDQVPAASLPHDDKSLASYAGYGRDVRGWKKVKAGALRGFILCEDERLYHPVVAEKALEAWEERLDYNAGKENERARKQRERDDRARMFAALRVAGQVLPWNTPTARLRELHDQIPGVQGVTGHAPDTVTGHAPDTANKGREGKRREEKGRDVKALSPNNARADGSAGLAADLALALADVGFPNCSPGHPDILAAAVEGITANELKASALDSAGKSIAYIVQRARGRRADAAQRRNSSSKPTVPEQPGVDPAVIAAATAKHQLDDEIFKIDNDCTLELITPEERDQRISNARAKALAAVGQEARA